MAFSVGSSTRKGFISPADGEAVALLKSAGGIPLLVSNTPEFCTSWESNNQISGRSLNPYDARCTPGGSSGGEVSRSYIISLLVIINDSIISLCRVL